MSKFTAYAKLQKQFGRESAEAIAEFVEAHFNSDDRRSVASEKLNAAKADLLRAEEAFISEQAKLLEQIAHSEANIIKTFSDQCNGLVVLFVALGVIITLINKFLPG